jgi:hypothetical protein
LLSGGRELVGLAARDSAAFIAGAEASNLGAATLEEVYDGVTGIAGAYVSAPLLPLFAEMVWLRDHAVGLLDGRQPPRQRRQLLFLAGAVFGLLAHASNDLGDRRAARTQARAALLCAEQADHPDLRGWVVGTQSVIEFWGGRPDLAARLAGSLSDHPSDSQAVRLAALEARGLAQWGRLAEAAAALHHAEQAREQAPVAGDVAELGGIFQFPQAKQRYYAASTSLLLGDPAAAADHARAAIAGYQAMPPAQRSYGDLSLVAVDLAAAHLELGELHAAEDVAGRVLALPPEQRIDGIHSYIARVDTALAAPRYAGSPRAAELRDRITAFRSATADGLTPA